MKNEFHSLIKSIDRLIIGKQEQIKLAVTCLLANGHLLIEDLPGMGKTTLSQSLSQAFGLDFSRVQFTSDLLPADMLGVNIFNPSEQEFTFKEGPIFNQLVLADEINRASPKTQSALLEAMEESQVSIEGTTYSLPRPFLVIGTQNPSYQAGTYPLPESQLDRFLMRVSLGYPDWESEKAMLKASSQRPVTLNETWISPEKLIQMQHEVSQVNASDSVIDYILRLVTHSRERNQVANPLSPRGSKAILHASKAWAYLHDRDYIVPEDVQAIFVAVVEHRINPERDLMASTQASMSQQILDSIDPLAA